MDLVWLKVLRNSCTDPYLFLKIFLLQILIIMATQPLEQTSSQAGILVVGTNRYSLKWGTNLVGRSEEADVTIDAATVSRFHIIIRYVPI